MKRSIIMLVFLLVYSQVGAFTIQDINNRIDKDKLDLNLIDDKVNLDLKTQEYIKIDWNGRVEKSESKSLLNWWENLDLNTIKDQVIEDNTEQGESQGEIKGWEIPANYEEFNEEILEKNIQKKVVSFEMRDYEETVEKIKTGLARYYNWNVNSILQWGIPSSFGFGSSWIEINTTDTTGIELEWWTDIKSCSETCNCGQYYFSFGRCKTIPKNSYSTGTNFKCLRWFQKSWGKCILQRDTNIESWDSPYDNIRYNGNSSASWNPYAVNLVEKDWIYNKTVWWKSNAFYSPVFTPSRTIILWECPINTSCPIKNQFLYTAPASFIDR